MKYHFSLHIKLIVLLATLFLGGCDGSVTRETHRQVSAPYCDSLHEIQGIQRAWRTDNGSLHFCIVGIPVGRVADRPLNRAEWQERQYSVTIPAQTLRPPPWIAEPGPDDVVDIAAENISPGCPSAIDPHWEDVPVLHPDDLASMALTETAEIMMVDRFNRAIDETEFVPEEGRHEIVVVRKMVDGGAYHTDRLYRLLRRRGKAPANMAVWTGGAVVVDSLYYALVDPKNWEFEPRPITCLRE